MLDRDPAWTIITLNIPGRDDSLSLLADEVARQSKGSPVEHLVHRGGNPYGTEMRSSLMRARGQWVSWVDDDDFIEEGYVKEIVAALNDGGPDVVTFGSHSPGHRPAWLRVGRKDNDEERPDGIVKTANHYCVWRKTIAGSVPWLPRYYGAEYAWYTGLRVAHPGLREAFIPKVLHRYNYNPQGTKCQNEKAIGESLADHGTKVKIIRHKDGRILMACGWQQPSNGWYHALDASGAVREIGSDKVEVLEEVIYK